LAWEEETVFECASLLHNVVLQDHILDRWRWILNPINGYFVKETYIYFTTTGVPSERGMFDDVSKKQVLLKVSVFAWWLLRNCILTKDNLLHRRIIPPYDILCIGGCGSFETADHLLFRCDHFGLVWHRIYQWLGISFTALTLISDHLH